jgi:phosphohistidine phosphatase SixA
MNSRSYRTVLLWTSVAAAIMFSGYLRSQSLSKNELISTLEKGSNVLVMRHASSPREVPDAKTANADNTNRERQLDEAGRTTATKMGKAMRDLKIPIGDVLSSPTYRALETVRLAMWPNVMPTPELGDGGQSMQGVADTQAMWLQKKVTEMPRTANTILVTHMPNLTRAFPQVSGVADGEALIFRPDGKGNAPLIGRIKIEEWPQLVP